MKRPRPTGSLSYEQHVELARHIAEAEAHLAAVVQAVQAAYGVTDTAMAPLGPVTLSPANKLAILKSRLDDHFCHDGHQGHSPYYTPAILEESTP